MSNKTIFTGILLLQLSILQAQTFNRTLVVSFLPTFGSDGLLQIDTTFTYRDTANIRFETFKCYLSNFKLLAKGQVVWTESNSYHLLNTEVPGSMDIPLPVPADKQYDALQFTVGIDSTTNTAGIMEGDLDPTKGMYWTWQNGYINFKLEGTCSLSSAPKHQFQYHLGGYLQGLQTAHTVTVDIRRAPACTIAIDLEKFLKKVDWSHQPLLMSPGPQAVDLSKVLSSTFQAR